MPRLSFAVFATLVLPALGSAQRGDAPDASLRAASDQRGSFHLPPGFEIQLVAAEPDLQKPFNLAFDSAGRVWVTGSSLYPWPARRDARGETIAAFQKNWDDNALAFRATATPPQPAEHGSDSVRVLSHFDPATGRAGRVTVFADGLNIPIGVLPLPRAQGAAGDTALVFSIPAIWRLTDTDGDGRADLREKLYDGFGFRDTHGMSSSYWLWYDGWVYGTHGFANASEVKDRAGRVTKLTSGNTYRFRPDGSEFQVYVNGQTNPFGLAFDAHGDLYTADSHSKPVYLLVPGGYYEGINREHDGLGFGPAITTDDHGSSAIAGIAHYSAAHFPAAYRDSLFNGNPVTRRINRARLEWRGSTPRATREQDFLTSDDPAFRPVQVKLGPDGSLWIADFYNPIIGHYEVPLTHPARDQRHGRVWRIIWRGLDGSLPPPQLPNLTGQSVEVLVPQLLTPNEVTRGLVVAELMQRTDRAETIAALLETGERIVAGADSRWDETAALAVFHALQRLLIAGASTQRERFDQLLERALQRSESVVAEAAVRTWLLGGQLDLNQRSKLIAATTGSSNHRLWRAVAQLLIRETGAWSGELALRLLLAAPEDDAALSYALRLALKAHLTRVDSAEAVQALVTTAGKNSSAAAKNVADVLLAVPSSSAAEFLAGHLERTKFAGPRAGEHARHAVLHLGAGRMEEVTRLQRALAQAPRTQRLMLAEGLAQAAAQSGRALPADVVAWMRRELLAALDDAEFALVLRAVNALRSLTFPGKADALGRLARDQRTRESVRIAALRALDVEAPETEAVLAEVLSQPGSNPLRRTAAELLGTTRPSLLARRTLAEAFASASADLSVALATALAKSEAGANDLVELVSTGRIRPGLLRHRYVEVALAKQSEALQRRAADLTRGVPNEDARLDALIAQRLGAAATATTNAAHGAGVFSQHCASCHRFRDTGGRTGPSLDGSEARTIQRLIEDILDPSRNVDPGYRLTTLTFANGGSRTGMHHRLDGNQHELLDPGTGEKTTIAAGEVAQVVSSPVSPMPAAFETLLSGQELFDLIAYLRTPSSN